MKKQMNLLCLMLIVLSMNIHPVYAEGSVNTTAVDLKENRMISDRTMQYVATVDSAGLLEKITAESTEVESVAFRNVSTTLIKNTSMTITADVLPENASNTQLTWSSSDPSIATVNNAVVTGLKEGIVTITAVSANHKTASCTIEITELPVRGIDISQAEYSLLKNSEFELHASTIPYNATYNQITWSSSDETVAIYKDGMVKALKAGTAVITATAENGKKGTCTVTVTEVLPRRISLNASVLYLTSGTSEKLNVIVTPRNSTEKIIWYSDNENVAKVDENGVVSTVAPGTAKVTAMSARDAKVKVTCEIDSIQPIRGIYLNKSELDIEKGDSQLLTASIEPSNATYQSLDWSSDNNSIAYVENGKVTALSIGTTTIRAEGSGGKEAVCTVTVTSSNGINDQSSKSEDISLCPMYRLYNPNSGEHFYTKNTSEKDYLSSLGWKFEGIGWTAPSKSNTPVYRLYNPNAGEHHYTIDANEKNYLVSVGWNNEGIGWYSDDAKSVPLYRQYNPNAYSCNHNYTTSKDENDWLIGLGWHGEGISWYGINSTASKPSVPAPDSTPLPSSSPVENTVLPFMDEAFCFSADGRIDLYKDGKYFDSVKIYIEEPEKLQYFYAKYDDQNLAYVAGDSVGQYTDKNGTKTEFYKPLKWTEYSISQDQAKYSYAIYDVSASENCYAEWGNRVIYIKTNNPDPASICLCTGRNNDQFRHLYPYADVDPISIGMYEQTVDQPCWDEAPEDMHVYKAKDGSGYYTTFYSFQPGTASIYVRENGKLIEGVNLQIQVHSKEEGQVLYDKAIAQIPVLAGVKDSMTTYEKVNAISEFIVSHFYYPLISNVELDGGDYAAAGTNFWDIPVATCLTGANIIGHFAEIYGAQYDGWNEEMGTGITHMAMVTIDGVRYYFSGSPYPQFPSTYHIKRLVDFGI